MLSKRFTNQSIFINVKIILVNAISRLEEDDEIQIANQFQVDSINHLLLKEYQYYSPTGNRWMICYRVLPF